MIIKKIFNQLLSEKKRYFLVTGGRNSSKSYSVSSLFTYDMIKNYHKILYTRYTLTSANISIIPEFIEKINILNAADIFKITNKEIICNHSQSEILFKGIRASAGTLTANLKSLQGITTWIYDEFEEQKDENEFDKIDLSIRSNRNQNRIVMIMNPTTKEHWIWQRWFENSYKYIDIEGYKIPVSTHPDLCHIHTTYLDNIKNIPADYLKQIYRIKEENPEKYKHIILGGWLEKAEGVIYENWDFGDFDTSLPYGYGLDFGFSTDPDALVKVAINERKKIVYLHEVLYRNQLNSNDLFNLLKRECTNKEIIADAAEDRLISDFQKQGLNIKRCRKGAGSVLEGIKILQNYKIIVTKNSTNIAKELNNYAYNDKKSQTPIDAYNHILDAARYRVSYITKYPTFATI